MSHIVFDVSGHGFGHLAQVAPVVGELRARLPAKDRITVRAGHPPEVLAAFLPAGVAVAPPPPDAVLAMHSPIDVDGPASIARYVALHADWPATVDAEAARLAALAPDLLVSDVGYVGLAAARRLGVAAHPLCSLDWYAPFLAYCRACPDFDRIAGEILDAYRGASTFLQLAPHLPMDYLEDRRVFGPVARRGRNRRADLERRFPALAGKRLLLFAQGGIDGGFRPEDMPRNPGVCWLFNQPVRDGIEGVISLPTLDLSFIDALASVDVVITKPGYGTLVEAVCNGVAVVSVERPDWPESPHLEAWTLAQGRGAFVPRGERWLEEALSVALDLAEGPRPTPLDPSGACEVAAFLARRLGGAAA